MRLIMNIMARKIFIILFVGAGYFLAAGVSHAATKTWMPTSGINWNTAANWSPSGVPTSTDVALFSASSTTSSTINAAVNVAGVSPLRPGIAGPSRRVPAIRSPWELPVFPRPAGRSREQRERYDHGERQFFPDRRDVHEHERLSLARDQHVQRGDVPEQFRIVAFVNPVVERRPRSRSPDRPRSIIFRSAGRAIPRSLP